MTSLSPAFLESHLLYLTRRLLKGQSKYVLLKLIASTTGSVRSQLHVDQTLYTRTYDLHAHVDRHCATNTCPRHSPCAAASPADHDSLSRRSSRVFYLDHPALYLSRKLSRCPCNWPAGTSPCRCMSSV